MRMATMLVSMLLCAACAANDGPQMATREDCSELRAIEARLTVAAGAPAAKTTEVAAELARHEKNLSAVGGEESTVRCMKEMTAASIECAKEARSLSDLERCRR
jgi:hypothetical protein